MPPGYYILYLSLLAVSVVKARKSQDPEWEISNTMSRERGEPHDAVRYSPPDTIDIDNNQGLPYDQADWPASGGGPYNDGVSSGGGWRDDEDYDDSDEFSGYEPIRPRTKCEELRASLRRRPLEGVYIPRCNKDGEYQSVQCDSHSSECWCVNRWGQEVPFTRGHQVKPNDCDRYADEYPEVLPPIDRPGYGTGPKDVEPANPDKPFVEPPINKGTEKEIEYIEKSKGEPEDTGDIEIKTAPEGEDDMNGGDNGGDPKRDQLSRSSIIGTPGLLPGIIGGAVVGLLCAVLLVMFIVYRMRKKDEGSYALEEPKMTSPSRGYTRAPTKEYWA